MGNFGNKMYSEQLTSSQKEILKLLVEYRFLTTSQIHRKLRSPYQFSTTWRWLSKLQELSLVTSFVCEPEKGAISQIGWLLTSKGANAIGFFRYNSHYKRIPKPELLVERETEISLEEQIMEVEGWNFIRPKTFSPSASLENKTLQYQLLTQAITWDEYLRTGKLPQNLHNFHSLVVPLRANQYVAYYKLRSNELHCLAVIFIVCPARAAEVFWNNRIKQYNAIAKRLPVVVVFPLTEKEVLRSHEPFFSEHNFRCMISEDVAEFLKETSR
jgi:Replication-relaxation